MHQHLVAVAVARYAAHSHSAYRIRGTCIANGHRAPLAYHHTSYLIPKVVQKAYISGPHTTYILVYNVYTSISVLKRILGATITTHAPYTTYILVFPYIEYFRMQSVYAFNSLLYVYYVYPGV